jgi:hypothetical protein
LTTDDQILFGCSSLHEDEFGYLRDFREGILNEVHSMNSLLIRKQVGYARHLELIPMNHPRTCELHSATGNCELWSKDWYSTGKSIVGYTVLSDDFMIVTMNGNI